MSKHKSRSLRVGRNIPDMIRENPEDDEDVEEGGKAASKYPAGAVCGDRGGDVFAVPSNLASAMTPVEDGMGWKGISGPRCGGRSAMSEGGRVKLARRPPEVKLCSPIHAPTSTRR